MVECKIIQIMAKLICAELTIYPILSKICAFACTFLVRKPRHSGCNQLVHNFSLLFELCSALKGIVADFGVFGA